MLSLFKNLFKQQPQRCIISEGRKVMACRKWQARQFYSYAQYKNWAEDIPWLTPMKEKEFDKIRNQL